MCWKSLAPASGRQWILFLLATTLLSAYYHILGWPWLADDRLRLRRLLCGARQRDDPFLLRYRR